MRFYTLDTDVAVTETQSLAISLWLWRSFCKERYQLAHVPETVFLQHERTCQELHAELDNGQG